MAKLEAGERKADAVLKNAETSGSPKEKEAAESAHQVREEPAMYRTRFDAKGTPGGMSLDARVQRLEAIVDALQEALRKP